MTEKNLLHPWPAHSDAASRYLLDTRVTPPEDNCLFLRGGKPLISRNDLHLIAARPKAGKSSFAWALVQAAVTGEYLGFRAAESGLRCLIVDTEMSAADVSRKAGALAEACGISIHASATDRVQILRLRRPEKDDTSADGVTPAEWRFLLLEETIEGASFDLVIVDGVHDLCDDVMDNSASIATSRRLQALAEQYDCAIVCVLHLNTKNAGETRGHLGSQLQRDCSDFFRLERQTDAAGVQYVKVVHQLESRHPQADPVDFVFGENGEAIPLTPVSPAASEAEQLRGTLQELFAGRVEVASAEIREALTLEGSARATGFRKIQRAVELGLITSHRKGFYELSAVADFTAIQDDDIL